MKSVLHRLPALLLLAATLAVAVPGGKDALKDVQKAINQTQEQIRQTRQQQQQVDGALAQTRSQLDAAAAELARISRQRQQSGQQLLALQQQLDRLQTDIGGAQAQVARLLNAHYRNRQPNAVMLLLQQTDAADKGRYLQYMRYLNRANENVIARLRQQQQQVAEQQQQINRQQQQLAALQQRQKTLLSQLGRQQRQQQQQSQALDRQLDHQNQQLAQLRANEKRLNRLVQQLAAQAAAKRRAEAEARRRTQARAQTTRPTTPAAAQTPPAANRNTSNTAAPPATTTGSGLTAEDMALQAPADNQANNPSSGFSRLQGRLPKPVSGQIAGQFGHSRPGGGTWKGLFIATAPASVHSIAAGDVAYAAPLQGYGNTVIIDHGDGYLSIYTGLSGISVGNGSRVSARQTIGRSGRIPNGSEGLYFEIRYRNQAMNPLSWLG